MVNFDNAAKKNIKKHNPNWLKIPDHLHRILITGGSGSGKANSLFNLISHQPDFIRIIYILVKQNSNF